MRARRKRFTKPRARTEQPSTHKREGVSKYRNSYAGRWAKMDALMRQREKQLGICPLCNQHLPLGDAKFESQEFKEDVENRVIHKSRCVQES